MKSEELIIIHEELKLRVESHLLAMSRRSEEIRIRYLYRSLILRRKLDIPFDAALKIVGPDCAYHLYRYSSSRRNRSSRSNISNSK